MICVNLHTCVVVWMYVCTIITYIHMHVHRYQIIFGLSVELLAYTWMVALIGNATSGECTYVYVLSLGVDGAVVSVV